MPFERTGNIALPFFHLRSEGFWHLLSGQSKEDPFGARLDNDLYHLLHTKECGELLRRTLIKTHFAPELWDSLIEQGNINHEAFLYSKELLERPEYPTVKETLTDEAYRPAVRDQGFRRAVVLAYEHRCAICGIRVRTLDGHTVVAAAHIRTWSKTYDDRPANGLALCRTCHWTFDEGLLRVSKAYEIRASKQLRNDTNLPGYLISLEGRGIVLPTDELYWPDPDCLEWHRTSVFRTN